MAGMFRSDEGRAKVRAWHDRFREGIGVPTEAMRVATQLGETHVLRAGPEGAPEMVLLHGALASSAHALREIAPILDRVCVYAVDIIGQSVMSAEGQPPVHDDTLGVWLREVIDGLGLSRPHLTAVSWGGFVAQRFAKVAPERIDRLVLLVPAGVVSGPVWSGFRKVAWPMMLYRAFPSEERLDRALRHLVSTPEDEMWRGYMRDAMLHYRLDMSIPKRTEIGELDRCRADALVIAARGDLSFPGEALLERARQILPQLVDTDLLDCAHCPPTTDAFRVWLAERVAGFLQVDAGHRVRRGDATSP